MNPLIFSLGGDSRFFWQENVRDFATFPSSWDPILNTGIGKPAFESLWINSYLNFTASLASFGFSWGVINIVFWVLPSILLSFFSAFFLFNFLFPKKRLYALLAGFIYLFNTYFLMVLLGGQLGVALAYSIAPLVLARFIKIIDYVSPKSQNFKFSILAGLVLAVQLLFDPRLGFITLLAVGLYWLFFRKNIIFVFAVPAAIAVLLHSYWIIPLLLTRVPVIPAGFNSLTGFKFFSFTDFSHALSLLHPNWPENIFGKTYFLQAEFLLLPILAFSSLLFISAKVKIKNEHLISQYPSILISFFALLSLLGAFLTKGSNPPFGEINVWLFQNFPLMAMFRDPTKFYILITLSYSVLIPFSLLSFSTWVNSKFKIQSFDFPSTTLRAGAQDKNSKIQSKYKQILSFSQEKRQIFNFSYVFLIFAILYLIFLIHPLWLGNLKNKFKPKGVPQEYVQLKDFLVSQPQFFRTLWLPDWQRFGYFSSTHPAIGRNQLLEGLDAKEQVLHDFAIKYIIVPYDSQEEIFLDDRQYDAGQRQVLVESLDKAPWLTRVNQFNTFGKITVYEVKDYKDRFWAIGSVEVINWEMKKPTEYAVQVEVNEPSTLVFSESFDANWQMTVNDKKIPSEKSQNSLNGFALADKGDYTVTIEYWPQRYVYAGLIISIVTLLASSGFLIYQRFGK